MTDDLEHEARELNEADAMIGRGLAIYVRCGWGEDEVMERVEELFGEAMNPPPPHVGGGPKRPKS